MPPSGYSIHQADSLVEFLDSCSEALQEENQSVGIAPLQALEKEIGDIQRTLVEHEYTEAQVSVLRLTADFYREVAAGIPSDYEDYREQVQTVLEKFKDSIRAIHVEPSPLARVASVAS